ncbi:MAG: YfhO family protein [Clostridiales bacterium]|nr:YfhO family protein [Clostridiales bacterium]
MIEKTTLEKKAGRKIDTRPLLAFFATMLAMILVFLINMITPFGNRNVLTSDLGAQYGPYLIGYKQAILSGESLFYNRSLGIGSNTLGVFAYYLSSPLNLIALLFPTTMIQELVSCLIIIKLSFAGAFMTWLLDRKFKTEDKMTVLFGLMYPLCTFAIVNMFQIMWLDGFAILPLLILLTEKFIEDRKKTWPVITLVLLVMFVSGYYIAYMVGIFSFIYLISVMGYKGMFKKETEKESMKTVGMFILSAITSAMMSACILLPAGLNTIGNPDYTEQSSIMSMQPKFKFASIFDQLVEKKAGDLSANMPYIFCGVTALFLCILFFFNPKIKRSLKTAIGVAFGFGILSFQFPLLNSAWHLFDDPNWFNFRYAFLFSFVMILVAFYSYLNMAHCEKKHFIKAFGIVFALLLFSQSFGRMAQKENSFFATLLFSVLISVLLYGKTLEKWPEIIYNIKKIGTGLLAAVIIVEIVVFNPRALMPDVFNGIQDAPEFTKTLNDIEALSDSITDQDWFRTEMHEPWHHLVYANNLPFYSGREGMSLFASMSNKKSHHFLKQLGYRSNYNYFSLQHDDMIMPADSILGVRYIISKSEELMEMEKVASQGELNLYKNEYALPAALLVKEDALSFDGFALEKDESTKDYFAFQEDWMKSLSDVDASDIYDTFTAKWEIINGQPTDIPPKDAIVQNDLIKNKLNNETANLEAEGLNIYLRNNNKAPLVFRATFKADRDGAIYFEIPYLCLQCETEIYVNDEQIAGKTSRSFYTVILNLGSFRKGDEVKVEVRADEDIFGSFEPIFAYVDPTAMAPQKEALTDGLKSVDVTNGHYVIETDTTEDKGILITAPYEKGWKAYVDGKETEIIAYQDALLYVPVSAGAHKVELRFTPPGWKAGLLASGLGVVVFAAVSFVLLRKKKSSEAVAEEGKDEALETIAEEPTDT